MPLKKLINPKTKEVIGPLIPSQIRAILSDFLDLINRPLFRQQFERNVLKADGKELAAVAEVHRDSVRAYNIIIQTIVDGWFCFIS